MVLLVGCYAPERTWLLHAAKLETPIGIDFRHPMLSDAIDFFPCGFTKDLSKAKTVIKVEFDSRIPIARTRLSNPPVIVFSKEEMDRLNEVEELYAIAHELGHVLGLDNDDRVRAFPRDPLPGQTFHPAMFVSLMASNVLSHVNRIEHGLLMPLLSRADERAIRERYCP